MTHRLPLAVSLLLFSGTAAAGSTLSHPVPLQNTECAAAPATASYTAHALFDYRIEASGAVQGIKLLYADAQPADRKAAFVDEVQACLARWKFKPATVDGVPAATRMKVAFHRLPPVAAGDPMVLLPGGKTVSATLIAQVRTATNN
ncbi:MAG TPA: hypothetical protein VJV75_00635, partial [Candidatus Polarisedimenticolia bacterium]|nr:hypothetical protein [Candidatus Polarisedimenticolia bacterium]